jgi:MFS family permease
MSGPLLDSRYEGRVVALLSVAFGLVALDRWIVAPLFPAMAKSLGLSYQDLGSMIGALGVAWGAFSILGGGLADRLGRRRVLVPAILGFSLLSGLSGAAVGLASLLFIRVVMGANEGACCPVIVATVNEASRPSRRGLNLGVTLSFFPLFGLALGPILATQLLRVVSWRWVFLLVAVPGLAVAAAVARTVREPPSAGVGADARASRAPLRDIAKHRNVPIGMLSLLCAMSGIFSLSAMVPSYLVDYLRLSTAQMGFITSAIGFGGFLGQLALPALSDLIGRRPVAVAGFLLGAVFVYAFSRCDAASTLFCFLFLGCFCCFGLLGLITGPIATEAAPRGLLSSTAGLVVASGEIFGGGLAPVIAGAIAQHLGIQYTLTAAAVALALGVIVSCFFRETAPRRLAAKGHP